MYGLYRMIFHCVVLSLFSPLADCGLPVAPRNGSLVNYTGTTHGSEVIYICDPGHVPEGRMRVVCTENGWSPNLDDLNCTEGMCSD